MMHYQHHMCCRCWWNARLPRKTSMVIDSLCVTRFCAPSYAARNVRSTSRLCKWYRLDMVQQRAETSRWLWATCEVDSCLNQRKCAFRNETAYCLTYADNGVDVDGSTCIVEETLSVHRGKVLNQFQRSSMAAHVFTAWASRNAS